MKSISVTVTDEQYDKLKAVRNSSAYVRDGLGLLAIREDRNFRRKLVAAERADERADAERNERRAAKGGGK